MFICLGVWVEIMYILPPFGGNYGIADGIHLVTRPYIWQTLGSASFSLPQPTSMHRNLTGSPPNLGKQQVLRLLKSAVKSLLQRHQREPDM